MQISCSSDRDRLRLESLDGMNALHEHLAAVMLPVNQAAANGGLGRPW
jgi:hypothetical protein